MSAAQLDLLAPATPGIRSFEEIVSAVLEGGTGITMRQLGTADALGRELEKEAPDPERVRWMARRLGLDPAEVMRALGGSC